MKVLGYIFTVLIVMFISATYSGYALSVLWGWFIVPTFDIPAISIPTAIGIALVIGFVSKSDQTTDGSKSFADSLGELVVKAFLKPSIALLIGWVVTLFN